MAPNIVIAFDLFGTLLSTESIAKELATHFGDEKAGLVAGLWRRYQLEYTWRCNSMGIYKPFSDLTRASLSHVLKETGLELDENGVDGLMKAYDSLDTFPEVSSALEKLAETPGIEAYIFSNGTNAMVASSVNKSPSLGPHAKVFKDLITVEGIGVFKPDPKSYHHLAKRVGKEGEMGSLWLVSANPFDIVGARAVGMRAVWVDRAGKGWCDALGGVIGERIGPDLVVKGLDEVVRGIEGFGKV